MIHSFNDIILKVGQREIYASDFNVDEDGWTSYHTESQGAYLSNGYQVGDPMNQVVGMKWTLDVISTSHYMRRLMNLTAGKKYKVTGAYYMPDGQGFDGVKMKSHSQSSIGLYDCYAPSVGGNCIYDEWVEFSVEFIAESSSDGIYIYPIKGGTGSFTPNSGDKMYIHSFVVTELSDASPGEIYCSSASIDSAVELGGRNNVGIRDAFDYFSQGPAKGQVNLSYFITGQDPVMALINSRSPVALELGGLFIESGYLNKYEFQLTQYNPITVSATFDFFEKVGGSFTEKASSLPDSNYFLTSADLNLTNEIAIATEEVSSLSYAFQTTVQPSFVVGENASLDEILPNGVVFGPMKFDISADTRSMELDLPASGQASAVKVNLNDRHGNKKVTLDVNGVISRKELSVSAGGALLQKISIAQGNFGGDTPLIYKVAGDIGEQFSTPTSWAYLPTAMPGDSAFIYGPNHGRSFEDVDNVSFMGHSCEILSKGRTADVLAPATYAYVEVSLPYGTPNSGVAPLLLRSPAGEAYTASTLSITGAGTSDLF